MVSAIVIYGNDLQNIPASIWVIGVIMQPVGCLFGYYIGKLSGLTLKDQRAISLETGVQNFCLAMVIITLTSKGQQQKDAIVSLVVWFDVVYFANSWLLVAFYRYYLAPQDDDIVAVAVADADAHADTEAGKGVTEKGGKEGWSWFQLMTRSLMSRTRKM